MDLNHADSSLLKICWLCFQKSDKPNKCELLRGFLKKKEKKSSEDSTKNNWERSDIY